MALPVIVELVGGPLDGRRIASGLDVDQVGIGLPETRKGDSISYAMYRPTGRLAEDGTPYFEYLEMQAGDVYTDEEES